MAELGLVAEEAIAEFEALRRLIGFVESAQDDGRALPAQPRLVASNASLLFIAAAFEEAVRQLGHAYAQQLAEKAEIPADRLRAIRMGLWEKAAHQLSSKPLGTRNFDDELARKSISILQDFCLDLRNVELMIDSAVYHSRNLRSDEVNALFKRLGVSDVCARVGRSVEYRNFFLVPSVARAQGEFTRFLNSFYEARNTATHDLGVFRAMGAVDVIRYVDFFQIAVSRLQLVLEADLASIP